MNPENTENGADEEIAGTPEARRRGRIDELIDSGFAAAMEKSPRGMPDGDGELADLGDLASQLEAALSDSSTELLFDGEQEMIDSWK